MNLIQLEYYIATIKYGSYAKAGRANFVSPQAVSKACGDLEKELDVQLLSRKSNSVSATELGVLFAVKAQEVLDSAADLTNLARTSLPSSIDKRNNTLAIGTQPFRGCATTTEQQERILNAFPNGCCSFMFNSDEYCLSAVNLNLAEAAIIAGKSNSENHINIKLGEVPIDIAIWEDHPFSRIPELHITDLKDSLIARPYNLTLFIDEIQRFFDFYHMHLTYKDIAPVFKNHIEFLREAHGAVLVYGSAPGLHHKSIVIKRIHEQHSPSIPISLVYKKDSGFSPDGIIATYKSSM